MKMKFRGNETQASKATKARSWSLRLQEQGEAQSCHNYKARSLSPQGITRPHFAPSVRGARNIGQFVCGLTQKRDTCFGSGKPGHQRNEFLLSVAGQAQPEGKKLSNNFIDLCESISASKSAVEHVSERGTLRPVQKRDFLERECRPDSV